MAMGLQKIKLEEEFRLNGIVDAVNNSNHTERHVIRPEPHNICTTVQSEQHLNGDAKIELKSKQTLIKKKSTVILKLAKTQRSGVKSASCKSSPEPAQQNAVPFNFYGIEGLNISSLPNVNVRKINVFLINRWKPLHYALLPRANEQYKYDLMSKSLPSQIRTKIGAFFSDVRPDCTCTDCIDSGIKFERKFGLRPISAQLKPTPLEATPPPGEANTDFDVRRIPRENFTILPYSAFIPPRKLRKPITYDNSKSLIVGSANRLPYDCPLPDSTINRACAHLIWITPRLLTPDDDDHPDHRAQQGRPKPLTTEIEQVEPRDETNNQRINTNDVTSPTAAYFVKRKSTQQQLPQLSSPISHLIGDNNLSITSKSVATKSRKRRARSSLASSINDQDKRLMINKKPKKRQKKLHVDDDAHDGGEITPKNKFDQEAEGGEIIFNRTKFFQKYSPTTIHDSVPCPTTTATTIKHKKTKNNNVDDGDKAISRKKLKPKRSDDKITPKSKKIKSISSLDRYDDDVDLIKQRKRKHTKLKDRTLINEKVKRKRKRNTNTATGEPRIRKVKSAKSKRNIEPGNSFYDEECFDYRIGKLIVHVRPQSTPNRRQQNLISQSSLSSSLVGERSDANMHQPPPLASSSSYRSSTYFIDFTDESPIAIHRCNIMNNS